MTVTTFKGPAAGSAALRTAYSPTGVQGRGTINNCANGYSPWTTYLTCEENGAGYFRRSATDSAARTPKEVASLNRYGVAQGAAGNYGWSTVAAADGASTIFSRWNASADPAHPLRARAISARSRTSTAGSSRSTPTIRSPRPASARRWAAWATRPAPSRWCGGVRLAARRLRLKGANPRNLSRKAPFAGCAGLGSGREGA